MALIRKMSQGSKTPILYTFYDKLYDFNNLQEEADLGLSDYLETLRRGSKDEVELRKAYQDIMNGIKDGSITFLDGKYIDSLGRYSNSSKKNKSKDHYGLMAKYIYDKQTGLNEYIKPSTNPKWEGPSSASKWFINELFGSEKPNLEYFIELDPYNEETKTRGLDVRSNLVLNAMKKLYNGLYIDNSILFEGLSDLDKESYKTVLEAAIRNAENNGIGKDDYLSFTKAFGDLGYDKWFSTDSIQTKTLENLKTPQELFAEWASENYPIPTRALNNFQITTRVYGLQHDDQVDLEIILWINLGSNDTLDTFLANILYNPGFNFNSILYLGIGKNYNISNSTALNYILSILKSRGALKQNGNDWFYKSPKVKNISLKLNGNSLLEISDWDNPFRVDIMVKEYNSLLGGKYSPYFALYDKVTKHKQGGIIKAQRGVRLSSNANWYSGVFTPQLSHILEKLKADKDYYGWLNDMQDRHSELYQMAGDNFYDKAYTNDAVGVYQDLYKKGYKDEWKDDPSGYNSLGIQNAYDLGMFDVSGSKRTSGDWGDKEKGWKTDNMYSAITDYRRLLGRKGDFTEEQLTKIREDFKNKGFEFIEDNNGYYKLKLIENPTTTTLEEELTTVLEEKPGNDDKSSEIYTITDKGKRKPPLWSSTLGKASYKAYPDLLEVGRLFASIRTNNKVAKTLRESLKPVLEISYNNLSPVTGASSEMLFRKRQGLEVEKIAKNPYTTDPSLLLAGMLDAHKQASDLEYQGFLANDKEIKRTSAEALARQEDNKARWTVARNKNAYNINAADREIAQVEAARLNRNWKSGDNFTKGFIERTRNSLAINNLNLAAALENNINWDYRDAVLKADLEFAKRNPNGTDLDKLVDKKYLKAIRDAQRIRDTNLASISYAKHGGSLKPNTMYLINKVIKNESNT